MLFNVIFSLKLPNLAPKTAVIFCNNLTWARILFYLRFRFGTLRLWKKTKEVKTATAKSWWQEFFRTWRSFFTACSFLWQMHQFYLESSKSIFSQVPPLGLIQSRRDKTNPVILWELSSASFAFAVIGKSCIACNLYGSSNAWGNTALQPNQSIMAW